MTKFSNGAPGAIDGSDNRIHLDPYSRITIMGSPYVEVSSDKTGYVLRRVNRPNVYEKFTYSELRDLIAQGLVTEDQRGFSPIELRLKYDHEVQFWHLKPEIAALVIFRRYFCDGFLELEHTGLTSRSDEVMAEAIGRLHEYWLFLNSKQNLEMPQPPCPSELAPEIRSRRFQGYGALPTQTQAPNLEPVIRHHSTTPSNSETAKLPTSTLWRSVHKNISAETGTTGFTQTFGICSMNAHQTLPAW